MQRARSAAVRYSGFALIDTIARFPCVRTLLLGHTHYNALEVFETGEELLPVQFKSDQATLDELASLESADPLRKVDKKEIAEKNRLLRLDLGAAGAGMNRALAGAGRELAIVHTTTDADLANQDDGSDSMFGFNVLGVYPVQDTRAFAPAQINSVEYWIHDSGKAPAGLFRVAGKYKLKRDQSLSASDPANPVNQLFKLPY